MNVMITGGTGFIGSHIAKAMFEQGTNVWILTRDVSYKSRATVPPASSYVLIDELLHFLTSTHIDVLICGAVAYGRGGESPDDVLQCNVVFHLKILEMMGQIKPRYIINLDTFFNKNGVCNYMFWYSRSKAWGTDALRELCRTESIGFVNLMLEQVYGPTDSDKKFATFVINSLAANVKRIDLTHGLQKRDFIFVEDVAQAVICVVDHIESALFEKAGIIEVGNGEMITIRQFVETVKRLSGAETELCFGAMTMAQSELTESKANIRWLSMSGWSASIGLEEGIQRCLRELKKNLCP